MKHTEQPEDDKVRRRLAIALLSVSGLIATPKVWTTPIINAVITPAHAQTSACPNILDVSVVGRWRFTDANGATFEVNFIDDSRLVFNNNSFENDYTRDDTPDTSVQGLFGNLLLDLNPPQAQSRVEITQESNCVASALTVTAITPILAVAFTPPATGVRI